MPLRATAVVLIGLCAGVALSPAKEARTCAIVGDSIALGIGAELPACRHNAEIGIPSDAVIARVDRAAEINIVSAGSNDPLNPMLHDNLERIRDRARRVIWILPIHVRARAAVAAVAAVHGDRVIAFAPRDDQVHPLSYAALAQAVSAALP
jgi:hypothetical protein